MRTEVDGGRKWTADGSGLRWDCAGEGVRGREGVREGDS